MKAITLWQPWASLLAEGYKQFETRSWATSYRGKIAIHAAQKSLKSCIKDLPSETLTVMWADLIKNNSDPGMELIILPTSCVLATAELVECHKIDRFLIRAFQEEGLDKELLYGDYTLGRYAWEFKNMTLLPEPIPAKGGQRIWNWEK